ncbi:MAG: FAD-dependent oxidoreductase [Phycisphaerales bacterium]|nr:FAD-dependent oxidoreductase [Phycisphaerales bacterium]
MKIAVVGTGISGLVAAHLLHRDHELIVYEAGEHVGGHTNTIEIEEDGQRLAVDTGFIVYNERTYPNFCRLLAQLDVATQPSDMSFSVRDERSGLEYRGDNLNTLFAQRRNLLRPSFYRLLGEILRFYRQSPELLALPGECGGTLGDYLRDRRYSDDFIHRHLVPMGAAIWSADPQQFLAFPAAYFVRFCHNHGMLSVFNRPRWRTITGGSARYVEKLISPFRSRIRLCTPVASVRRAPTHVEILDAHGGKERVDRVVLATHSDRALRLLADPTPTELAVLGVMRYQRNDTVLHTDERLLPRSRRAWASWNYHIPAVPRGCATLTYNMNRLQSLAARRTYCVTLNCTEQVDERHVIRRIEYHHPVYTLESIAAQRRWAEISGVNRTHYCGAYWGYGFHEDGVNSALAVCRQFGRMLDERLPSGVDDFVSRPGRQAEAAG